MAEDILRFKDIQEMDGQGPLEKPLSFNDLHNTQYRPGEDELTNYRAYRRKRIQHSIGNELGEQTQAESLVREESDVDETKEAPPGTYFTKTGNLVKGQLTKSARDRGARQTDPKDKTRSKVPPVTQQNESEVEEALTTQQRMQRRRTFQRIKPKIKLGRERAKRRIASKEKLMTRTRRQIRQMMLKKLTKDIPKSELTFARRQELEKRLEKPALKRRIDMLVKKEFPKVRKAELSRKRGGSK